MNKSAFSYYVRRQRDTARIHRRCCAPCSNWSISPAGRVSGKAVAYVETDRQTVPLIMESVRRISPVTLADDDCDDNSDDDEDSSAGNTRDDHDQQVLCIQHRY